VLAEYESTVREERSAAYVTIVLPCYNEEGHVIAEIERITAAMDASGYSYELMCVDDASTDGTLAKLYEAAPRFPQMEVVHFHRNSGSGTVRRIGTQRAKGEIVVWTDADMSYPNERIPELVQILRRTHDRPGRGRADAAGLYSRSGCPPSGSSGARRAADRGQDPRPELAPRAFRREVSLPHLRLPPAGFSCVTTITVSFLANNHELYFLPIDYSKRAGKSKFKFVKDAYRYILQVLRMTMYFNPLKVLMPVALSLLGIGFLKAIYDVVEHPVKIATDTVLIFVTGLLIASLALLADLIVRSRDS
jgi:glycosyltransferase involved in cell wall biosynthesis